MLDLTGKKFGRLTVAWLVMQHRRGRAHWLAFCDCGAFRTATTVNLQSGHTNCCMRETLVRAHTKHGYTTNTHSLPEYRSWDAMIQRCSNPNGRKWKRYGGRGIKVCERWLKFENFIADMGPKPEPKKLHSIDRINNDGNYEPGNCRWATYVQQNRERMQGADGRFLKNVEAYQE